MTSCSLLGLEAEAFEERGQAREGENVAGSSQNRKNESIRRANRIIQSRTFALMLIMGILMFVLLFFRLYDLQITRHEELQGKAVSQQTRRTVVTASRGTIYDASGNILAISASAETIILSPLEIDQAVNSKTTPVSWTKDSLAAGLADILVHPQADGEHRVAV